GAAQIDHAGLTRFSQQNLAAGDRMTATVELPAGTVPANEVLVPAKTLGGAFVLTAPVGWAWAGFGALLLALAALVWAARRRDAGAAEPAKASLLAANGEFASPAGALPGHVGLLLRGRAGPLDLAATVLDLAVRNYLWVSAEEGSWRLARRNPPDEHLTPFERAVFEAVLPEEPVTLAELRQRHVELPRTELDADVVRRGWFATRRLRRAGIRIVCYGLFLTVLLALTVGYAQLGVILALAGVAAVVTSAALPARRRAGADVAGRLRGLAATRAKDFDKPQREQVFSRGLPYALALGELAPWVAAFDRLKHPPSIYWHAGDITPDQAGSFATALAGTFAPARRARLLDAVGRDAPSHQPVGTHATAEPS
ncbi:DUF2207 family protein, partial [Amycolatopsis sp.]|uniref:DUF2207 family protein n=1 Tax=Amycolatopsis sp. TaxID=37632 RepID=UPI002D7FC171